LGYDDVPPDYSAEHGEAAFESRWLSDDEQMTNTFRLPAWLWIAVAVLVVERAVLLTLPPVTVLSAVVLAFSALIVWLLLRGSRVAWIVAVFSSAAQLTAPFTSGQPVWVTVPAAIILVCLLAPASREYIWAASQQRKLRRQGRSVQESYSKLRSLPYGWAARLPALERQAAEGPRNRGKLILLLSISIFIAAPLVGVLYRFHHGAGSGSLIVDVLWHVIWIVYSLTLFALIGLLMLAAYSHATGLKREKEAS
jgi:hypothetical protein